MSSDEELPQDLSDQEEEEDEEEEEEEEEEEDDGPRKKRKMFSADTYFFEREAQDADDDEEEDEAEVGYEELGIYSNALSTWLFHTMISHIDYEIFLVSGGTRKNSEINLQTQNGLAYK
jgi:cobalamin biosynthesis protein CobT